MQMGQNNLSFLSNAVINSSDSQWQSVDGIVSLSEKSSKENNHVPQSVQRIINQKESNPNDSMIGLELGKRTYFEVPGSAGGSTNNVNVGQMCNNKLTSSQKRPRNSTLNPKCQVEGCKTDLSSVKEYHRRHKVCPLHSKSTMVIVSGQEQRFCQQCSRFHGLIEFDEGKRSCRRRLAGHNERRRKPQPDAFGLHTRFLPAFQDNRRFGRLFSDRYFPPNEKMQGMSALWDDSDGVNGERKGIWSPRMIKYEDQSSSSSCSLPASGMGMEQLFLAGLQHQNERQFHFLPQSPKGTNPGSSEMPIGSKANYYGSVSPLMHQSLSLMSSGSGGLEAIPVGHGFTRVSDSSGCALSLQSTMQLWSSAQTSVAESLDSTSSLMSSDHDLQNNVRNIPIAEPLLGQPSHQFSWANDKLLSAALTSHDGSSGCSNTTGKENVGTHFSHSLNGAASECLHLYSMLHSGEIQVNGITEEVKPTIDLMQVACTPHGQSSETMGSSEPFDIGACQFGELQAFRSYGSSIFSSQHI